MEVRLLGPVCLDVAGTRHPITSRACRSLLAGLALRAGQRVSVDVLTEWVWGEDDLPEYPGPALQTVVSRLRRTLRQTKATARVETDSGGYVLRIPREQVDALRFESEVARARRSALDGEPTRAVEVLDEALALWAGEQALADVTAGPGTAGEAARLEELRLDAVQDRIGLLLGLRPPAELLAELAWLSSHHPLREGLARHYMLALDACDRRAEALEVYRRLAHAMHDELGLEPAPQTRALHARLLTERPSGGTDDATGPVLDAVAWPVRVGTPPALAAAFQARAGLRARIEAALVGDAETVVVTQVMAGDGGVGKTQLAADVFYEALDSGDVDLGVWVTATSRDAVLAAYAAAYKTVHPPAAVGVHQEIEERAAAFLAWLASTERTWIVVLDDVADCTDLNLLRPRGRTGRTLVTTRRRDAAMTAIGSIIDVGLFTPRESLAYLGERLHGADLPSGTLDDATLLAADLGHLPLALAQASAVIINDAITCADYRALLTDRTLSLAEVFPTDPKASGDDYAHALPAAWSLATERAAVTDPLVRPMLALVAVLDPNGIPENVLLAPAVITYLGLPPDPDGAAASTRLARCAIRTAHQFSLLTHTAADPTRSVRMHALAQRAVLERLSSDELSAAVVAAADALLDAWPDMAADPDLAQVLRANSTVLAVRDLDALWHPDVHALLFRAGHELGLMGQARQAVDYHVKLLARARAVLGADHPSTLRARHKLGEWRGRAGDVLSALHAMESLLVDQLRVLGPDHCDTLTTRYDLADYRGESGDAAGAAAELEHLASDCVRVLGPEDWRTLSTRHDWAYWRGEAGDRDGSLHAYEELLVEARRLLGPGHRITLSTRHFLARARGLAGDPAAALTECDALLDDAVTVLGPDNPYTLTTRQSLAEWRGRAGDAQTAYHDLDALLVDMLRILGPDHPETLGARHAHAHWLAESGDPVAAVCAYRSLLSDALRILGPEHPRTVAARVAMEEWQSRRKAAPQAVPALQS